MKSIYFDYASATPISHKVLSAMLPYFSQNFYNPSALYLKSQHNKQSLEKARQKVANIIGAKSSEVIFVAGGTESTNLAINGIMSTYLGSNLIVSAIEHEAVLAPARKYDLRIAEVDVNGRIDLDNLRAKIDDDTVLVSVMQANNEIGTIQPIKQISQIIKEIRFDREQRYGSGNFKPIYLHTDACQATNYLSVNINELGVDLLSLNGGKIYGPKQSGILYIKSGIKLMPQILGGGQEKGLRSGTENLASSIGFAVALEETVSMREHESRRLEHLQGRLEKALVSTNHALQINGGKTKLVNNIHFTLNGLDNERLLMELDEMGVMVAVGSACSASSNEPSHVLAAISMSDDLARSSIRITLGRQTNIEEIDEFIKIIRQFISKND